MKKMFWFVIVMLLLVPSILKAGEYRKIHVFVALCDNVHQGIIPVPELIGNGQDARNNMYWGALYGVKTYFKRSDEWELFQTIKDPKKHVLERIVFKHKDSGTYLLADAYDGRYIKEAISDFMYASNKNFDTSIVVDSTNIAFGGKSDLVAYIGHDGLMEFQINCNMNENITNNIETIILSCKSKIYFNENLRKTGAFPLLWTTGYMAPEAYTLKSALDGWILGETNEEIRLRAAQAYHKYQKCGLNAAKRLLVTGW